MRRRKRKIAPEQGWFFEEDFLRELDAVLTEYNIQRTYIYELTPYSAKTAFNYLKGGQGYRRHLEAICESLFEELKELPAKNNRVNALLERLRSPLNCVKHSSEDVTEEGDLEEESEEGTGRESVAEEREVETTPEREVWRNYRDWFAGRVNQRAFGMDLIGVQATLPELFIPLRMCPLSHLPEVTARGPEGDEIDPSRLLTHAVDAESWLTEWARGETAWQGKVVLQGHPGSGKSSLARVFAHRQLQNGRPVVFIPLQRINLARIKDEAVTSEMLCSLFDEAIADSGAPFAELATAAGQELVLVLDALDELQLLDGKPLAERFLTGLWTFERKQGFKTLITTRHQTTSDVRDALGGAERFELLRYFYPFDFNRKYESPELLATQPDYREDWWRKFGDIVGRAWDGVPSALQRQAFEDFTCDPFNNLMAAIAYMDAPEDSSIKRISDLYERILAIVQKRGFDAEQVQRVTTVQSLPLRSFETLLQDVAVAAWHNGGRVASMDAIRISCEKSGHRLGFEQYIEPASYGASNILLQFYFRNPNEQAIDEKKVEFTHKSFSDWLLVRKLTHLARSWSSGKQKTTFDALLEWFALGDLRPEHSVLLHSEFGAWSDADLDAIRVFLENHLSHIGDWGFDVVTRVPTSILTVGPSDEWQPQLHFGYIKKTVRSLWLLADIIRFERNQRQSDDKARCAVSRFMFEMLIPPTWKDPLGGHFRNIQAADLNLAGFALSHLLMDGVFTRVDFEGANLSDSVLDESVIADCIFKATILRNASLESCHLRTCSFVQAIAQNTNFSGAILEGCDFGAAILPGAQFDGAQLTNCHFLATDLRDADFTGVSVDETTSFEGATASPECLRQPVVHTEKNTKITLRNLGWVLVDGKMTRQTDR